MDKETIINIQNAIGYEFKNSTLLDQAFTRKSYSNEHPEFLSNEVLEFYGDSALSIYVSKKLFDKYSKITEDDQFYSEQDEAALTEIKSFNVNTRILSHCIQLFGFQDYLYLNESDEKNKVYNSPHVQEDLFEAIIGAVAADSNWDFERIFHTCETMLKLADFEKNYISWLMNWCKENGYKTPIFQVDLGEDRTKKKTEQYPLFNYRDYYEEQEKKKNKNWANYKINKCVLTIKELSITVDSDSDTLYDAQMDCAEQVYYIVQAKEMRKAVGNPDFDNSVNQLNMLAQKGFIDDPEYDFTENHDDDGNPVWVCDVSVDELEDIYYGESSIKKEAKKEAAYYALCDLLDYDPDLEDED